MAYEGKVRSYDSDTITVSYDIKRCIHAKECIKGLPVVFDTDKRPWIQPQHADADAVAEVIHRCPTGALQYTRKDDGAPEPTPTENIITLVEDGPLYLRGQIEITDINGQHIHHDTRVALCRCGASKNKPFCDNSHLDIEFHDEGVVRDSKVTSEDAADDNTQLTIIATPNGPYLSQGAFQIVESTGETACSGNRGALCRCGGSGNKPFCDGTHTKIGFEAE